MWKLRLTNNYYWIVLEHPSGMTKSYAYWTYYYDPKSNYTSGKIAFSNDNGYTWVDGSSSGNLQFKLGWSQGEIKATATNQDSIDIYGRHFKKIVDSSITTLEQAQARADLEVSGMTLIPKQGRFVINGKTDMSNEYLFSANLTNYGIDEKFDIKSYTQRIDKNGFTTEITYGKHTFDIAKKVAVLEHEMGM